MATTPESPSASSARPSHEANGANVITQYNHIWDVLKGITSDGGTLYYNVGDAAGTGMGNKILNNLVHDVTDTSIIDSGISGSAYGGTGIYVDHESAGVDVENNVVFHMAQYGIRHSDGVAHGQPPNTFHNNIFAFARRAMYDGAQSWVQSGCDNPTVRDSLTNNIFVFLNFKGNLYWRNDGGFATYPKAFHVLTAAPANPRACSGALSEKRFTYLTFAQWQDGHERRHARHLYAGRDHPVIHPPKVPDTFPTYAFTEF